LNIAVDDKKVESMNVSSSRNAKTSWKAKEGVMPEIRNKEIATLLASQSERSERCSGSPSHVRGAQENLLVSLERRFLEAKEIEPVQLLGEMQGYIDRLRGMLVTAEFRSPDDTFNARPKGLMAEPSKRSRTR
jgi:hypothetical protein